MPTAYIAQELVRDGLPSNSYTVDLYTTTKINLAFTPGMLKTEQATQPSCIALPIFTHTKTPGIQFSSCGFFS